MEKLNKCNSCLFFTKEKIREGLKLKIGYHSCPTPTQDIFNKKSAECECHIHRDNY